MGNKDTKPAFMPVEVSASFTNLKEEITCSVCLYELNQPVAIACGHTFCRACISSYWATSQPQGHCCPECRKVCPKDQLIPAYRLQQLVTKVQMGVKEEQAKQAPPSAVPLVYTDAQGQLQLDETTVQQCFLDDKIADYPLSLICVIGEKRRGKSTLMNYILRALECQEKGQKVNLGEDNEPLKGFAWSAGADSLTKGIWIWNKPFILERNGQKMATFLLDTEGSLDIESDRETCLKLSALSMLLSSFLIFNINSSLKTTELDYLEMYLHVAELMVESFSLQHLQHLNLLVRDWQDPDHCGHDAARAYLEHEVEALRKTSKQPKVLQTLRSPCVSGFLLPHPGKGFLRSADGRLADMDEDFRSHLTRYIVDLVGDIWKYPKTDVWGQQITCAHLADKLKEFVSLLQKQKYSFASPIEMFHSLENRKNLHVIVKRLQEFVDKEAPSTASIIKVLGLTTSQLRSKIGDETSNLLHEYKELQKGENREEKENLVDEMKLLLAQEQERLCAAYAKRFTTSAVKLGCMVGGGVLSLAGGAVGAAVAGVVIAAEAAIIASGAIGGTIAMGAIGTGVGAAVGGVIGHTESKKVEKSQHGGKEDPSEDTQQLLDQE